MSQLPYKRLPNGEYRDHQEEVEDPVAKQRRLNALKHILGNKGNVPQSKPVEPDLLPYDEVAGGG